MSRKVINVVIGEKKESSQTIILNEPTSQPEFSNVLIFSPEERISIEGIPSLVKVNAGQVIYNLHLDVKGNASGVGDTEVTSLWYSGIGLDESQNSSIMGAFFQLGEDGKFYLSIVLVGPFTS